MSGKPGAARSVLLNAFMWSVAWALLGASCGFGPKSTGDVLNVGEMWGLLAVGGGLFGLVHGIVYGVLRRLIAPPPLLDALRSHPRTLAGVYGTIGGAPWLLVDRTVGLFMVALCFFTAFALPGHPPTTSASTASAHAATTARANDSAGPA